MAIVDTEADNPQQALQSMGTSTGPIAQWFRRRILEIHGLDRTQPMPGPTPELLTDERF